MRRLQLLFWLLKIVVRLYEYIAIEPGEVTVDPFVVTMRSILSMAVFAWL